MTSAKILPIKYILLSISMVMVLFKPKDNYPKYSHLKISSMNQLSLIGGMKTWLWTVKSPSLFGTLKDIEGLLQKNIIKKNL